MTAVLALGERPETARYRTQDPEAVDAFLLLAGEAAPRAHQRTAPRELPMRPSAAAPAQRRRPHRARTL
jgi:hypothetical protein